MSADELEKLKENIDGIYSVNTFFSTTRRSDIAVNFIQNVFERPFFEKVLYEIHIRSLGPWKWPFADIHDISCNSDESEILFDIGTTLRIDDVYELTKYLWCVDLTLVDIHDPVLGIDTQLYDHLWSRSFRENESTMLILCTFLEQMGEYERVRQFCYLMLRDTSSEQELIDIQIRLSVIELDLGNCHEAKHICEQTIKMQLDLDDSDNGTAASSALSCLHSHIGLILSEGVGVIVALEQDTHTHPQEN